MNSKSRANIPQGQREIIRLNMRFDKREKFEAELARHLADPSKRAARVHELLTLGFQAHKTAKAMKAERYSTSTATEGEEQ